MPSSSRPISSTSKIPIAENMAGEKDQELLDSLIEGLTTQPYNEFMHRIHNLGIRSLFYEHFIFAERLTVSPFFGFHGANPRNLCLSPFSAVA